MQLFFFFFFQAEDGIRDYKVTGVQTCALPISRALVRFPDARLKVAQLRIPNLTIPVSRHHIELVEYEHPRGAAIPLPTNSPGVRHWAFVVDDIHAEVTRLKGLGVRFKSETPNLITEGVNRGGSTIYFLDPDGITLELMQPPV